jgi:hypothetical protein
MSTPMPIRADRMASYTAMPTAVEGMSDYGIAVATDPNPATAAALPSYTQAERTLVRESGACTGSSADG